MFLLINIIGQMISDAGLADEFVNCVIWLEKILGLLAGI